MTPLPMELRILISVLKREQNFFFTCVLVFLCGAWLWQINQNPRYQATLLLDVGRTGSNTTNEYTYDSFYRLQADERFSDTVVRWLQAPRVVSDIISAASLDTNARDTRKLVFSGARLSSNVIQVTYVSADPKILTPLASALVTTLNQFTASLNTGEPEKNWFVVLGSEPVIHDARVSLLVALSIGIVTGVFIGFWGALLRHYFSKH